MEARLSWFLDLDSTLPKVAVTIIFRLIIHYCSLNIKC